MKRRISDVTTSRRFAFYGINHFTAAPSSGYTEQTFWVENLRVHSYAILYLLCHFLTRRRYRQLVGVFRNPSLPFFTDEVNPLKDRLMGPVDTDGFERGTRLLQRNGGRMKSYRECSKAVRDALVIISHSR